jgi:hypothetical protein
MNGQAADKNTISEKNLLPIILRMIPLHSAGSELENPIARGNGIIYNEHKHAD